MSKLTACVLLAGSVAFALAQIHSSAAEILIGFANPLTGEMELAGEQMQNGVQLAMAELNAAGGVLGQEIIIQAADDYCDAEQGSAAARKLVADRVSVVIGHLCSGTAIPVSPIYEAAGIPLITLAANPLLTDRNLRFTFRSSPPDDANAEFAAQYMVRKLAATRIAIVHDMRVYGQGLAEMTRDSLVELGVTPVLFEAVQPGQLVFGDLIERLRDAQIDVLYYGGYPREVGLLRRQLAEAGFVPPMVTSGANSSEEYDLIAGEAGEARWSWPTAASTRRSLLSSAPVCSRHIGWIRISASREVTPAPRFGRRRSQPPARPRALPWLRRSTQGRFASSASKPTSMRQATCRDHSASPLFGSGTNAGQCRFQRILRPPQRQPPAPEAPPAKSTEA